MPQFYADLKRICETEKQEVSCETTNWEAGNCVQNEKLIHSFKNKYDENNQLKDEKKYEETVSILRY